MCCRVQGAAHVYSAHNGVVCPISHFSTLEWGRSSGGGAPHKGSLPSLQRMETRGRRSLSILLYIELNSSTHRSRPLYFWCAKQETRNLSKCYFFYCRLTAEWWFPRNALTPLIWAHLSALMEQHATHVASSDLGYILAVMLNIILLNIGQLHKVFVTEFYFSMLSWSSTRCWYCWWALDIIGWGSKTIE